MKRRLHTVVLAALLIGAAVATGQGPSIARTAGYEVWLIDQSGTAGTLYIYDRADINARRRAATPETLALDALCPGAVRGHMLMFNQGHGHGSGHAKAHAVISFVGSGHVLFMKAATREAVTCIDVGVQAHAAVPAPDQSYVIVADQNGKKLHRIDTDLDADGKAYEGPADIGLEAGASLDLATCTTPSGAPCQDATLRPDNAPICPIVDSSSRLAFTTLRGGGLLVVDATTTPMSIVAEYDRAAVHPNGCGGLQTKKKMYINSGGPGESHLYAFSLKDFPSSGAVATPNSPAPYDVYSKHGGSNDAHGMLLNESNKGRFLWIADRFSNDIEVVSAKTDELVDSFSLAGPMSADPAPDLIEMAPGGDLAFVSLRGECPLTANSAAANNAVGTTPGLGVIRVERDGREGRLAAVLPISNPAPAGFDCATRTDDAPGSITNQADPHGLAVRATKR